MLPRGWWTQPLALVALGLLGAGAAYFATGRTATFVLTAAGSGCFAAGFVLALRSARSGYLARRELVRALRFCKADPSPCFITDPSGTILAQNASATQRFGDRSAQGVARAVGSVLPNAASVVQRIALSVGRRQAAHESVVTSRGVVRLLAHKLPGGLLWRLEDATDALRTGGGISLPMMIVNHDDRILSMNEAMQELLGRRPASLPDIFPAAPPVSGRSTAIRGAAGEVRVLPVILAARDGRREVYFVPGLRETPSASIAARAFEALPAALVHLSAQGEVLATNPQAQTLLAIGPEQRGPFSSLVEGLGRPIRDWVADHAAGRLPTRSEVVRARKRPDECFLQVSISRINDASGVSLLAVLHDATELKTLEQQFVQSQKMQAVGELAGGVAHDFNNLLTAITGHCDLLLLRHDLGDEDYSDLIQINQNANRAASLVGQLLAFSRKQTLEPSIVDLRDTMGELTHLLNRLVGERIVLKLTHDPVLLPIRVDQRQIEQVIMNLVVNARDAMPDGGTIRIDTRVERFKTEVRRDSACVPPGTYVSIRVRDEGHGIPQDKLSRIFEPFFTTKEVGEGTGLGLSMAYGVVKQTGGFIFVDSVVGSGTTFTIHIPAHDVQIEEASLPAPAPVSDSAPPSEPSRHRVPGTASGEDARRTPANAVVNAPRPDFGKDAESPTETSTGKAVSLPRHRTVPRPHAVPDRDMVRSPASDDATPAAPVILLVEDEAPVRAFASRALRLRGYTVLEAEDAEAALKTAREPSTHIDLFVTDVVMPGMDGPTWVRRALADRPGVKVVFVSGYSEDDIGTIKGDIPGAVFLPKPFSLSDLTTTVARQLA